MLGLLALLAVVTAVGFAGILAVTILVKAVLWAVLLPIRLVFWIVLFPLLLAFKLVFGLVLLLWLARCCSSRCSSASFPPATIAALAVPLLPLVFLGFVIWLLVRSSRPAVA